MRRAVTPSFSKAIRTSDRATGAGWWSAGATGAADPKCAGRTARTETAATSSARGALEYGVAMGARSERLRVDLGGRARRCGDDSENSEDRKKTDGCLFRRMAPCWYGQLPKIRIAVEAWHVGSFC